MDPAEARVPAFDHGFLYGDGLFETLRTYGGEPFRLREHLARLEGALSSLGFERFPSNDQLRETVSRTLRESELPEAYVRITVTRGVSSRGLDPAGCSEPTVMVAALPLRSYPEHFYREGVRAVWLWSRASGDHPSPTVKSTSYQRSVLARRELARREAQEGFFLDEHGHVTEGSVSNVFCVRGRALITPPASCCLPGITRAETLSLAREAGLEVSEGTVSTEALLSADEVFVTSSLAELLPVVRVEDRTIGSGRPGPIHRKLHEQYRLRALGGRNADRR